MKLEHLLALQNVFGQKPEKTKKSPKTRLKHLLKEVIEDDQAFEEFVKWKKEQEEKKKPKKPDHPQLINPAHLGWLLVASFPITAPLYVAWMKTMLLGQ